MSLILVMGIPGAGKTSLCAELVGQLGAEISCKFSFDEIFNDDNFIGRIWGETAKCPGIVAVYGVMEGSSNSARMERKRCEAIVRSHLVRCKEPNGLKRHFRPFIFVDDIFYLRSMRRPFIRMARSFGLNYAVVFVDVPLEMALKRNECRKEALRVDQRSINNIYRALEKPVDGVELSYTFTTSSSLENLVEFLKHLRASGERDCSVADNWSDLSRSSQTVGCDSFKSFELELRKCVAELIVEKGDKTLGKQLAKKKKEILRKFQFEKRTSWNSDDLKSMLLQE